PLYGRLLQLKAKYLEFLRANLREDLFPIASAILLGEKALIPQDTKDRYAKGGLNHILVVSGLHLGLLAGGVFLILRLIGLRLSPGGYLSDFVPLFLCGLITVFYVAITGFHVSGQRAMLMIFVFLLSFAVLKRIDSFSSLAIAGLAILFVDPHNIFSLSFQLSFLAVLGVIWANDHIIKEFAQIIHRRLTLNYYIKKLLTYLGSLIIVSISVNLFLLPILVYNFNQFSVIGAFVNLICVPLLGILVVPFGLASLIISTFSESLGSYILIPSSLGLILIDGAVRFASKLSFASFFWVTPYLWEMALFYLLIFLGFFSFRGKRLFGFSSGLLLLFISFHLLWVWWDSYGLSGMDISFLDVGQGNSTFIRAGKGSILIDAGGLPGTDYDVGKGVVSKFLWHKRVRSLDLAILTHPDYDHMQGFQFLLEAFYVKRFLTLEYPLPLELVSRLKEKGTTVLEVSEKITISDRYYHIEIFHPTAETISFCSDLNDLALILKVSSQYGSVLITGDNGSSVLDRVAEIYGSKLKADVLLIPHHGSKSSLSKKFYKSVKPRLAVISCGYKNPYSLPNKEVLNALQELNIEILSTNTCGSITVSLMGYKDDGDVQMKTQCFLKQERIS
ncbi:MAG: DNA internalization-related competence protein ComEC/Rec2, partial [Desulfatiglandales bacterium]